MDISGKDDVLKPRTTAENLLRLGTDRALINTFGITETRRMMLAEQHVREGTAGGA